MSESVSLEIPLLLPGVDDDQDACVARLVSLLEARDGIERIDVTHGAGASATNHDVGAHPANVAQTPAALCLHYDPERISLDRITDIARESGATIARRYAHEVIPFHDIGSEDEGALIETALRSLPGVTAAAVNFAAQLVRVEYDRRQVARPAILARLAEAGATPLAEEALARPERVERAIPAWYARNRELAWSLTAGAFTVAGWLGGRSAATPALVIALYAGAYLFGARDNVGHFLTELRQGRFHFNIDLLMVVAAAGAAVLGEWADGALLLFLFSLGHALQHYALGRARGAIKALAELAPLHATLVVGGRHERVPVASVVAGDVIVVKPGERVPVDGTVREGHSAVNQAPITGESVPTEKRVADKVFAGTVNGEGALVVNVTAAVGDRTLDRVIKLVAEAQTQKAPTQRFTERFERVFVPLVLVADILLIVVPPLIGIWTWPEAVCRAMAVLVAASPCALALGTPAAVLSGIAQAARHGVLIKGGAHLESLGTIDTLALDKTGTITLGEPAITDVVPLGATSEAELLAQAAAAEALSQHPLARAVLAAAKARGLVVPQALDAQAVTGKGIRARVGDRLVEVGHATMFGGALHEGAGEERASAIRVREVVQRIEREGKTAVVVRAVSAGADRTAGAWLGVIGIADVARANARQAISEIRAAGVRHVVMLTGDNIYVGQTIAGHVGITDVRAGLLPEDKVAAVRELAARGMVAMVGDGVNDAPALAHATVGIAMGGAGTAAALETADVALMGDDLSRLPFVIGLSRAARRVIRQNLVISLAVIVVLVVSSALGGIGIGPAVFFHEGSTLVVLVNGLRLLRYGA
jgi:Cd2+/Zn2+-exporting ATPase